MKKDWQISTRLWIIFYINVLLTDVPTKFFPVRKLDLLIRTQGSDLVATIIFILVFSLD